MVIKFKKEEIDYLKKSLSDQQQAIGILELFSAVTERYQALEYPITSFGDFIKKLSKREGPIKKLSEIEISIGKEVLKIDGLKRLIPAYYFPISNKEDFEDKATELYSKKTIPAEQIPPFPDEFRNIDNKSKESQAS